MRWRTFHGLLELLLSALCLWTAWYHTPAGALVRSAGARVLGRRSSARPLLAYYSAGVYAGGPALAPIPPPPFAVVPPEEALGLGASAGLQQLGRVEAPAALGKRLTRLGQKLGSEDAAMLALFVGEEDARFARERALAEGGGERLEDLARQLPPGDEDRVALASQAMTLATAYGLGWPVAASVRVTSPFGMREHPTLGGLRLHAGVDLGVAAGTPVRATAAGVVRRVSEDATNGRMLLVDHGRGVVTLYCHNDALLVTAGEHVAKGQVISRSGNTGRSTGPHLHYQLDLPGGPVDPFRFRKSHLEAGSAVGGTED